MPYKDYLKTKHWENKKRQLYKYKYYKCLFCSETKYLHAHHITYNNLGDELIEDLVWLCKKHHIYVHKSQNKDEIQGWLKKIRLRNIKTREKFGVKTYLERKQDNKKKKYKAVKKRSKYFKVKFPKVNQKKNYAGLFTWKAEELKNLEIKRLDEK